MKNQSRLGVREMSVGPTPQDKGLKATITLVAHDNGYWMSTAIRVATTALPSGS
jgi:hypothetical protein